MKIKDDDKKYLILLVIVLLVTIISTLILHNKKKRIVSEKEIARLTTEYEKTNRTYNQLSASAIENTKDKNAEFDITDETRITEFFLEIDKYINAKDFDKLLSYYNKEYIEEFNITKEKLMDKFNFQHEIASKINIKYDKTIKDRVIVTARMINEFKQERIFDFTLYKDGTIADLPLYKEIEMNREQEREGVIYTLKKKYTTRLGSIYMVNITNNSEHLVDIQEINGYLGEKRYDHELIDGNIYTYKITPKKSVDLIIKICNEEKIDRLELINKKYDDTLDTINILEKRK